MATVNERYLNQLQKLLPPGAAWPTEPDAELTQFLGKIAAYLASVEDDAQNLLIEADPRKTIARIDDWEASLGLPDADSVTTDLTARRQAVVAKLRDMGGARATRFISIAAAMGYENTTLTRFRPFTCGSKCNDPLYTPAARFVWQLELQTGKSIDTALERVIRRATPAISHVLFNYGAS